MQGDYFRTKKEWIIRYKHKGDTVEHIIAGQAKGNYEFFRKNPPAEKAVLVEFTLSNKQVPDYGTIKLVVTTTTTTTTPSSQPVLPSLPDKFKSLNQTFRTLSSEVQKHVLGAIEFRAVEQLQVDDVKKLLEAAKQDIPLAFTSPESFQKALLALISRPDHIINGFSHFTNDGNPILIMVHGSSVGGLRGKKKDTGWKFDKESDIDVSIIDMTRFVWAQALGITTYGDCNSIELSDQQLHLLKLYKFADRFRQLVKGRQTNFCIYKDAESGAHHSGFTLMCQYTPSTRGFCVKKIYVPEFLKSVPPDQKPITMELFFADSLPTKREEMATNEIVLQTHKKVMTPEQGNHVFNDVHATLETTAADLEIQLAPELKDTHNGCDFVKAYILIVKATAGKLVYVSRDQIIATDQHGKDAEAIMKGFEPASDAANILLYGNAATYFRNCSLNVCRLALHSYGSPKGAPTLIPVLKKAFSNLLDCAIDEPLLKNLKKSHHLQAYALNAVEIYRSKIRTEANQFFKDQINDLMGILQFERVFDKVEVGDLTPPEFQLIFDSPTNVEQINLEDKF